MKNIIENIKRGFRDKHGTTAVLNAGKILFIFGIMVGCNWLDVVPDNLPTIDDAFSNKAAAEKSLFSCYRYLPDPTSPMSYPAYFTSYDEFHHGSESNFYTMPAGMICRGEQNTNSPIMNYWSGGNGGVNMYQAIRTCNIFLEGIHQPRDLYEEDRIRWIAEVKFLKAYYHFWLVQLYGPVALVKENIPISATSDEVRVYREPVDECIDYIVELIDEALPDLPLEIRDHTREDGRITQPIALAVKAKALVWAASPLFNGNTSLQGWRDSRDKQLMPDYSGEKWERAAAAIKDAIDICHDTGHELYKFNKFTSAQTYRMSDSLTLTMNARKVVTDRWNTGVVWSSMAVFVYGNGYFSDLQRDLFPVMYPRDYGTGVGYGYASFNMAELFYTNNGIPINEDIHWDYAGRYQIKTSTPEARNGRYIPTGQQTASLHFDREARFYGNLGFDRGFFEIAKETENSGASFKEYLNLRMGGWDNATGYAVKKLIAFETSGDLYEGYDYRFPLIRLADLYLLYSEALNEIKSAPDDEVYQWIDAVRAIAGLKGVVESWGNSRYPNRPKDKDGMRNIIRQERMIELAFEGQRFWDVRRWKTAENLWTYIPKGWNKAGTTAEEYYSIRQISEGRKFMFKDYLWPISTGELRTNKNLVQTYGW